MQNDKDLPGISCGLIDNNVFSWEVMLMLPDESGGLYGGGCFRSRLDSPRVPAHAAKDEVCHSHLAPEQ